MIIDVILKFLLQINYVKGYILIFFIENLKLQKCKYKAFFTSALRIIFVL